MIRSLYAGVAGLKTHQTRMDVIGNNIANVNTTAYKSQSMTFSDLMYQTTQAASGANATTGVGGTNARQIGLGSKTSAIKTAITQQGATQTTNDPFDVMITGESFFVVNNGSENFFTRDGSIYDQYRLQCYGLASGYRRSYHNQAGYRNSTPCYDRSQYDLSGAGNQPGNLRRYY